MSRFLCVIILPCVITHVLTVAKAKRRPVEKTVNYQHLFEDGQPLCKLCFISGARYHIKWPDKRRPRATSDKVSGSGRAAYRSDSM